jgi:DNA-binding transcriptional MerR regulator
MSERIFYSMGEVAEMMDVTPTTLRFWERNFDSLKPQKNKNGKRMFSPEDIRLLKTIYHLVKERGMTLAGAQKYLKANRKIIERDMQIAERLGAIRALLVEVRHELGEDGIVVENAAIEEVTTEIAPEIAAAPEPVAAEVAAVVEETAGDFEEVAPEVSAEVFEEPETFAEPEPRTEPETFAEQATEAEPEPQKPVFVEQTLF